MAVTLLPFAFPGLPDGVNVRCWFQMRTPPATGSEWGTPWDGGNISFETGDDPDSVSRNRRELFHRIFHHPAAPDTDGFKSPTGAGGVCELRQVHGSDIIFEPEVTPFLAPSALEEGDGMATGVPGRALLVKTADCQAILLAHESGACVAALHVGWRGNRANFPGMAIRRLCGHYGLHAAGFLAVRGPSLGPSAAQFVHFDAEWGPDFVPWHDRQHRTVDLWRMTRAQLLGAGLREDRIFALDLCTHSLPRNFFSYRRSRICGRQAAVVMID